MNKKEFIRELAKRINYSEERCILINDVLESNFFISKKSKDKILDELITILDVDMEEAEKIYLCAVDIIKRELKDKLTHPFRSK